MADLPAPMHPDHVLDPTVRACKRRTGRPDRAHARTTTVALYSRDTRPGAPGLASDDTQTRRRWRYGGATSRSQDAAGRSKGVPSLGDLFAPASTRPRWRGSPPADPSLIRPPRPPQKAGPCGHRSPPRPRAHRSGPLPRAAATTPAPDRAAAAHAVAHLGGDPAPAPARQAGRGPSDGSRTLSRSRRRPGPRTG